VRKRLLPSSLFHPKIEPSLKACEGCSLNGLPSNWPSLTVAGVHAQGHVLDLTATPDAIEVHVRSTDGSPLVLDLPAAFAPDGAPTKATPQAGATLRFPRHGR
jgi:hypothetical protein